MHLAKVLKKVLFKKKKQPQNPELWSSYGGEPDPLNTAVFEAIIVPKNGKFG